MIDIKKGECQCKFCGNATICKYRDQFEEAYQKVEMAYSEIKKSDFTIFGGIICKHFVRQYPNTTFRSSQSFYQLNEKE